MERRDAACLYADASGYSRLIATDLQSAVSTLMAHRALMSDVIEKHNGRVVDTAGDSMLAEFETVGDAVWSALHLQRELESHNAALRPDRRMLFRVGIEQGEILAADGRIYGDCVNVAARVQELAAPGTVCLAGSAYDEIEGTLPLPVEFLGERTLRNRDAPVRVYRVRS
jgi:class 3 adenylate cyclase